MNESLDGTAACDQRWYILEMGGNLGQTVSYDHVNKVTADSFDLIMDALLGTALKHSGLREVAKTLDKASSRLAKSAVPEPVALGPVP